MSEPFLILYHVHNWSSPGYIETAPVLTCLAGEASFCRGPRLLLAPSCHYRPTVTLCMFPSRPAGGLVALTVPIVALTGPLLLGVGDTPQSASTRSISFCDAG